MRCLYLRKQLVYSLLGTVISFVAAAWFLYITVLPAAAVSAAVAIWCGILSLKAMVNYRTARLICENPILQVGVASVTENNKEPAAQNSVNVVVSGFGILMDEKPYKFGHSGIKLKAVTIDRENINLSFGDDTKGYSIRLLHGVSQKEEVNRLTERLRYETGVVATVNGW